MAEQTDSKVPQIRFEGFEGEWDDKPIGEVLAEKKRPIVLKDRQRYELITVKRRNEGVVSRGHLLGQDILVKNYSQLQAGDFVISKRQVVHGATGIIPQKLDGAIVSNEYLVAVNSSSLLTEFLTLLASLPDMRRKFFLSSYGVDIEKLFFDAEDWKTRNVTIPGITEQTQIGGYFRELDRLIGLHQRKHDKLVTLKKAMLQKMFPQAGASTPEIRLKGFSGGWVERKICELGEVVTGSTPSTQNPNFYSENGIPWVTPTDIETNITLNTTKYLSAAGAQVARIVPMNTILVTCIASIGKNTLLGIKGSFNQQINGLVPFKEKHDPYFLYTASALWSRKLKATAASGTMQIVNKSEFSEVKTHTPEIEEQQKIGTYFRTFDSLIAQHATQLQKLQQLKSACLQQMFV